MNQVRNHIITDNSLTVVFDDGMVPLASSHRHFGKVRSALLDGDHDKVCLLLDVATRIKESSKGRFEVVDDTVVIDNEQLPETLAKRLIQFVDNDLDTTPLVALWMNVRKNRSEESKRDLFSFLDHLGITITTDGCFIAYKRVRGDFRDVKTGKLLYILLQEMSIPWEDVDPDRNNHCSHGLHAATFEYADKFYPNGILIEVKINPKDVVAVPIDYNGQKMRVCKMIPLRVCDGMREEPLYVEEDADYDVDEEYEDKEDELDDDIEDEEDDDIEDVEDDDDEGFDDEEDNGNEELVVDEKLVPVSADCRVNIPASLVKQVWPNAAVSGPVASPKKVVITVYEHKLLVGDKVIGQDGEVLEAFIDHHYNIRIFKSALVAAGLDKHAMLKAIVVGKPGENQYIRVFV